MARTRAPGRVEDIAEAGLGQFLATGYRRTRMTDIADAAGVSSGLLYTYAESKEALFSLVLQRELGVDVARLPLPVPTPEPAEIQGLLRRAMKDIGAIPALDAAVGIEDPDDAGAEIAAIVGEHYDAVHRHRRLIKLVERCATDWPELADRFYEKGRRPFVRRLGDHLRRRIASGHLRPVPDPDVAARYVIETVAWFANHRYGDHDGAQIDDDVARATVVQLLTAGLIGDA